MARPFVFPNPNDRSPNDPSVIVSSTQVLGLYNQDSGDANKMTRVTEKVQDWFAGRAQAYRWDSVNFAGNQCMLGVEMQVRPLPADAGSK